MAMQESPRGRTIEDVDGDPDTIVARGEKIGEIGRQMIQSASVLKELAGDDDQRGKAIDKVREIVGDTYTELRRAGTMYEPTGPVLVTYGRALADVQPDIRRAVSACDQAWTHFAGAPGFLDPMIPSLTGELAELDVRKKALHEEWVAEAEVFDRHYDTWEDAFDQAADGIDDVLDGSIKDSFWDNADGVISVVLEVLGWVGLVIAIAGIIIGGPIFALIGAVIGVVTLLLTAYQVLRDDAGMTKLIIAIVGVVPFGKVGKLFQGKSGLLSFGGDMVTAFRPSAWSAAGGQLRSMSILSSFAGGGFAGWSTGLRGLWTMNNPAGVGDVMTRLMFGKNTEGLTTLAESVGGAANGWCNSTVASAAWEGAYTMVSGSWKLGDNIAKWTGQSGSRPSTLFPWVGAIL